ncbi:MAG: hypothetical protein AAFV33_02365 [Chloroflexota bacterium]
MIRNIITTLIALALLVASASTISAQTDQNLPVISNGETVESALNGNTTAVLFAFNAAEGDTVTVNLGLGDTATFDPVMLILGPAGQVAAATDSSATINVPFSGSYFILVSTVDSIDSVQLGQSAEEFPERQPFIVSVSGNNPPPQAGSNLAYFRSALEDGTSFEGYSSPAEPVYFFVFDGSEGETIDIILTSSEVNPLLMVFDPAGILVGSNDDAQGLDLPGDGDAAIEGLRLPTDGTYLVFATDVEYHTVPARLESEEEDVEPFEGGDFVITLVR